MEPPSSWRSLLACCPFLKRLQTTSSPCERPRNSCRDSGGGIAGLVAAYELGKAGWACTLLEARQRPGGRNWSIRNGTAVEFADGTSQSCAWDSEHYFNAGPARLPSTHRTMLGYQQLGVALEVEITLAQRVDAERKAQRRKPVEQRRAVYDTRGHFRNCWPSASIRARSTRRWTQTTANGCSSFFSIYGDLNPDFLYRGSERSGVKVPAFADLAPMAPNDPLLLRAADWYGMLRRFLNHFQLAEIV